MKKSGLILLFIIFLVISSLTIFQPSVVHADASNDWPMFGHDLNHTGYTTATGPTTNPATAWYFTTDSYIDECSPTIANGILYAGSLNGHIYALNAITGAPIWICNTNLSYEIRSSPAIANGVVYVGQNGGYFYALNATTGALIWEYTQSGTSFIASPAVVNDKVYACDYAGNVYCFHALTNDTYWIAPTANGAIYSSPAVVNGVVYVAGYTDHNVYALNASTGASVWTQPFQTGGNIYGSPTVANGVVYIGSWDQNLYAINASTGQQIWSVPTGGSIWTTPDIVGNVVYFASNSGNVSACNAQTGASFWNFTTTNSGFQGSPIIAGNTLYIGTTNSRFYAINTTTGTQLWLKNANNPIYGSAAVSNGLVYCIFNGVIYAYGTPTVPPTVSVSPTSWTMNVGQSKTFTAAAVGGSGTYTSYQWYIGGVPQSGQISSTFNYSPSVAGSYSITATATDDTSTTSAQSTAASVTVNLALVAPVISVDKSAIDKGQTAHFSVSTVASGGTTSYSYLWLQKTPSGSFVSTGITSQTFDFAPDSSAAVGTWNFEVQVTDSASTPVVVTSNVVSIAVAASPTVTTTPTGPLSLDVGQTQTFTATPSGGSGTIHYQWYVGAGTVGTDSATYLYTAAGTSASITCKVTDSASVPVTSLTSNAIAITVAASPTVSVAPVGPLTMDIGQVQAFTATPSGGSGTISFQWYLDGSAVGSNSASYSYTAAGTSHSVTCKVIDSASTPVTSPASNAISITVNPAASPTPSPTAAPTPVPTAVPTAVPTSAPTPTPIHTATPTPSPTVTASPTPTVSVSPTPISTTIATGSAFVLSSIDWIAIIIVVIIMLFLIIFILYRRHKKTIDASAGPNGKINPNGKISIPQGDDQTFKITADANYRITDVQVDGKSIGAKSSYTFTNVKDNHSIAASFEAE